MTRRQGMIALLMMWAGLATKDTQGQSSILNDMPQDITFTLGRTRNLIVEYRGERVTLDAKDVFEALKAAR